MILEAVEVLIGLWGLLLKIRSQCFSGRGGTVASQQEGPEFLVLGLLCVGLLAVQKHSSELNWRDKLSMSVFDKGLCDFTRHIYSVTLTVLRHCTV